jgi:hypothetical protein
LRSAAFPLQRLFTGRKPALSSSRSDILEGTAGS